MKRDEFRNVVISRIGAVLAWILLHVLCRTIRLRVVGYENVERMESSGKGFIYALWHGRSMLPIFHSRGKGIWVMTALSRDGELQTRLVSSLGYRTIRGSTRRGGIKAALIASKKIAEGGVLAITPDGPLGPPNEVQDGVVFLAHRSGCPIIPVSAAARRRKLLSAWDSYMIPSPFTEGVVVYGEPIILPANLSAPGEPTAEEIIKKALDDIQNKAQALVREGE